MDAALLKRRHFGLQLFKDQERFRVRTLFGSLTDPAFVSKRPDAAAAALVGTVSYVWAGAVLHVRHCRLACARHTFLLHSTSPVCDCLHTVAEQFPRQAHCTRCFVCTGVNIRCAARVVRLELSA